MMSSTLNFDHICSCMHCTRCMYCMHASLCTHGCILCVCTHIPLYTVWVCLYGGFWSSNLMKIYWSVSDLLFRGIYWSDTLSYPPSIHSIAGKTAGSDVSSTPTLIWFHPNSIWCVNVCDVSTVSRSQQTNCSTNSLLVWDYVWHVTNLLLFPDCWLSTSILCIFVDPVAHDLLFVCVRRNHQFKLGQSSAVL